MLIDDDTDWAAVLAAEDAAIAADRDEGAPDLAALTRLLNATDEVHPQTEAGGRSGG